MNELFVQTADEVGYDFIEFAKANHYGIEITCFALPWILDRDWEIRLQFYKKALKNFENEVATHGVFIDMITSSRDSKIVHAARERILRNIDIAEQLGAKIVVFVHVLIHALPLARRHTWMHTSRGKSIFGPKYYDQ